VDKKLNIKIALSVDNVDRRGKRWCLAEKLVDKAVDSVDSIRKDDVQFPVSCFV
jgi:hypothetical protein